MAFKLVGSVLAAGALTIGVFGWNAWSYVKTSVTEVTGAIQDSVPVEFEIRRARTMLNDLIPEVHKNMVAIAQEEAALAKVSQEIATQEERREKDAGDIVRLKDDVASGKKTFQYAGKSYNVDSVKADLARRFERRKVADETLENLRKMHTARERSLTAARDKMTGMLAAKRQLEVEIEQLDSRLKMVEAARTTSSLCLDDGRLSRTRQLIDDLKSRLDVSEKLVAVEGLPVDEIQLDDAGGADIVEQVTKYFGDDKSSTVKVAQSK
ncbi:MAG: hypothetical protein C0483_05910 [Pirellula sp.]|nr:hypothetical protein [Pirellula sp.]